MSVYEDIIENIKKGVVANKDQNEKHEVSKKQQVIDAKNELIKQNFKMEGIAKKIVDDLKGYVNQSYIRSLLESEFKNQAKVREQNPPVILADGSTAEPQGQSNETKEEKNKRLRQEYEENKYYSGVKNANKNIGASMSSATTETQQDNTTASGKLFVPTNKIIPENQRVFDTNEQGQEVKHEQLAIEIDADILDQIVILRQQNSCEKANLIIDAKTFEVITVRASK